MPKAAIYARYSSHSQREESIEDQVRVCREAAERAGDEVVAVYADSAKTGRNDDRPDFQRMLAAADRGAWQRLYIYKQDRFARNRFDAASNKMRLRRAGVSVVSVAEHIPDGADGILLEALLEGMAEYYSANLSQNIRRGMEGNALKCMTNGRRVYGYRTGADGRYEVRDDEARVVREIFGRYARGETMRAIIGALGPVRTRSGAPLTPAYLSKMLRREEYVGTYSQIGHRVEGGMPAIVDRETWMKVQERLKGNPRHRRPAEGAYPLSGKVFLDGAPLAGSSGTSATGRPYRYYRSGKTGQSVSAAEVEERVAEAVARTLCGEGAGQRVADLIMHAHGKETAAARAEVEALEARLADNGRESSNIVDAIAKAGAQDSLTSRLVALRDERADIESALVDARAGIPRVTPEMIEFWLADIVSCREPDVLLAAFVSRVDIDVDGRIFVSFHMQNDDITLKNERESSSNPQVDEEFALFPMVEARRIELRSIALP